jgi:hypothetical protein
MKGREINLGICVFIRRAQTSKRVSATCLVGESQTIFTISKECLIK